MRIVNFKLTAVCAMPIVLGEEMSLTDKNLICLNAGQA